MKKFAEFIVKQRTLLFVIFAALIVYCIISIPKVQIEYSIDGYLPDSTDTKKAIEIMDEEFVTFGAAKIMIRNVSYAQAEKLYEQIKQLDGVKDFAFENSEDYYKQSCALFNVSFEGNSSDPVSAEAYRQIITMLDGYDIAVPVPLVNDFADQLLQDMVLIVALAALVILIVLLITSKSFAEILAFPIVFIVAAILNMGTNYWLGTISFISNTVCIILQLALAIDYAIILCHRFTEEKEHIPDAKQALASALSKAVPEILSSCLTTISGLLALVCMQLKLGEDLGIVLAKSIVCSIFTVFFLMPGVLLTLSKLMDKSRHRNFVPKITGLGKAVVKTRYILPVIFIALVAVFGYFQANITYVYSQDSIDTDRPSATQLAKQEVAQIFGYDTMFAVLMPKGDYAREREVLEFIGNYDLIDSALGIANVKINDDTYLTDSLTYRKFADVLNVSLQDAKYIYYFYAIDNENYGIVTNDNIDTYTIPLIDIVDFAIELSDKGYIKFDGDRQEEFDALKTTLQDAEKQLIGENYTRLIFNIASSVESKETFALIETMLKEVKALYPDVIFAGESMSSYDLANSFETDNLKISLLTVAFIYVILLFTFKSWGLPLVLVAVIQGAIFINFGYVTMMGSNLFFFVYLIVSAIQMGATIDYAILVTNRFSNLKLTMDKKTTVAEALNQAFPTIITSGTIMTVASFLIGFIVSEPLIASIGLCLGRGTIISIISVMLILPAVLYILDKPLSKTSFDEKLKEGVNSIKKSVTKIIKKKGAKKDDE